MNTIGNAIGYRRLSERDQSKYSLEYQNSSINEYCKRNNLNLIGLYTDNGESSYTFDRPDYQALELFIKKHKGHARYLIIMDHDRFSRNLSEALTKINELEDRFGIKVLATNEPLDLDTDDPYVFMQRSMSYMLANSELLRIRKRTKDGIRQAQISGRHVNNAPFGYVNCRDSENKAAISIDEEKASLVQYIFREYLDGKPIFEIHQEAKKRGFKNSGHGAIQRILGNPIYAGLVKVTESKNQPERLVPGLHQPIISEADFWLAQEKLGNKRASKVQPREEFPLRGILKCWCGKSMTAGFSKGKSKYYLYYRCIKHTETNIPGALLHEKFEELLDMISFTERQVKKITQEAKAFLQESTKESVGVFESRTKQLAEVNKKVDRLEERLMNDEIDGITYKKWLQKYSMERALLSDALLKATINVTDNKWKRIEALLPELTSLKNIYKIATLPRKQALIRGVFKHKLTYSEGAFRTPDVDAAFSANVLTAKEKGLLFLEQPNKIWDQISSCSP